MVLVGYSVWSVVPRNDTQPPDRLTLVLDYLRRKYAYCFWCGTQYADDEDMDANCPGPDEDAHD